MHKELLPAVIGVQNAQNLKAEIYLTIRGRWFSGADGNSGIEMLENLCIIPALSCVEIGTVLAHADTGSVAVACENEGVVGCVVLYPEAG